MTRDWESWLHAAARPASETEEAERDRTEERIRRAIRASSELPTSVRVYAKGSYANNTNVRRDADVDIAVEWTDQFKVMTWGETERMTAAELAYTPVDDMISPADFRARVERALRAAFGTGAVDTSGNKAIDVAGGSNALDADVVPCFTLRRYDSRYRYVEGTRLFPRNGGWIDNYPKQHYENGVAKNTATGRRFKAIVRCLKRLEAEMLEARTITRAVPGYLIECLVYNVPNDRFGHNRLLDDTRAVFGFLWNGLRDDEIYNDWAEVNDLKYLFRASQTWTPQEAFTFIDKAWDTVGVS